MIRHKLVEMDRHINANHAWCELLSWRLNQGDNPVAEIAEAKVAATTTFELCAREAAQILGGASFLHGDTVSVSTAKFGCRRLAEDPKRSCEVSRRANWGSEPGPNQSALHIAYICDHST